MPDCEIGGLIVILLDILIIINNLPLLGQTLSVSQIQNTLLSGLVDPVGPKGISIVERRQVAIVLHSDSNEVLPCKNGFCNISVGDLRFNLALTTHP
jgi:hypothetical protein